LHIALITPELHSLVRRTNLAGVAESLARALHSVRQEVAVFLPATLDVDPQLLTNLVQRAEVRVKDVQGTQTFRVSEGRLGDLRIFLFEHDLLFGRRHPYGNQEGPYPDNWRRYALFSMAVLQSFDSIGFMPEVLHCMDWTTGLIPLYHRRMFLEAQPDHLLSQAGTYFAIHNLAMQGVFEREILPHVGIPHRYFRAIEGVELGGKVNFLKAGAEFATIVGTHSPGHALKIQERDRGYGLEETFQRRKKELVGISNGIDYQAWNPENDQALPAGFGPNDKDLAGKRRCKAVLQASLKLDNGPRTPIACTIGRWDADGGFDLVAEVLTEILERNVELVVMGQGSPEMTQRLTTWEGAFVGRMRVIDGYDPADRAPDDGRCGHPAPALSLPARESAVRHRHAVRRRPRRVRAQRARGRRRQLHHGQARRPGLPLPAVHGRGAHGGPERVPRGLPRSGEVAPARAPLPHARLLVGGDGRGVPEGVPARDPTHEVAQRCRVADERPRASPAWTSAAAR
jgi:starch synthase